MGAWEDLGAAWEETLGRLLREEAMWEEDGREDPSRVVAPCRPGIVICWGGNIIYHNNIVWQFFSACVPSVSPCLCSSVK